MLRNLSSPPQKKRGGETKPRARTDDKFKNLVLVDLVPIHLITALDKGYDNFSCICRANWLRS